MLTVIAGEDAVTSRAKLQELKQNYQKKGYSVIQTAPENLSDVLKNSSGVIDLFGNETVYFVENISSKYKGRTKTLFKEIVQSLVNEINIHIIDWENGKSAYELSGLKRIATHFEEYKPGKNVFQLLDFCYPGNLKSFVDTLRIVAQYQEITFIYALLWKHIRKLIQVQNDALDPSVPPWQKQKLREQSLKWKKEVLVGFYENLSRIDTSLKTNQTPYDLKGSLELIVCYYLR